MEREQVLVEVSGICREVFGDPGLQVNADTAAKDVANWDSMTNLFLIDSLEQKFKFKFSLDEIMNAQNVGELCDIIAKRCQL
jgi:acyl carrier protein